VLPVVLKAWEWLRSKVRLCTSRDSTNRRYNVQRRHTMCNIKFIFVLWYNIFAESLDSQSITRMWRIYHTVADRSYLDKRGAFLWFDIYCLLSNNIFILHQACPTSEKQCGLELILGFKFLPSWCTLIYTWQNQISILQLFVFIFYCLLLYCMTYNVQFVFYSWQQGFHVNL